jgi:catechol 2,3-dioxygenase-like lactoylglutathione lyase family enzyme
MFRIAVVSIPVADQERSKQFYSELLQFKVVRDEPMGPDQRWIQLAPSASSSTITLVTWFDAMPPGSMQGIVLQTDNVHREYKSLQGRGLKLSEIKTAPWGIYATFEDPDGNGWVLQEMASRGTSRQVERTEAWD